MAEKKKHELQVIIASGPDNHHRATMGFAFAASAAVSGMNVLTVLAGDGVIWIRKDESAAQKKVDGFEAVRDYIKVLVEQKTDVCLCSTCAQGGCTPQEAIHPTVLPRLCYSGFTEMAIDTAQNQAQVVVF